MGASQHTESIKSRAAELGFDACAVAKADTVDSEDFLGQWLARGYHADMAWMARTKTIRQDVQTKLPGTRSVVVVARNYNHPRPAAEPGTGRVSRYAWGRDYHRVLRKPLHSLATHIESLGKNVATYCSIDSGPVLEKFWAARAGIGWIGKNSLILRQDLGSWFFLGIILTTLELRPDAPMRDFCGACRRCIDACPTNAIVEPRVVDSRRCISYHTIENRGDIPGTLRSHLDHWVFGCDICQEVCPWNSKAPTTNETDFYPRPNHANLSLEGLEEMTEEEFKDEFEGTPIMRAKLAGMQRNARIVRKNQE
ncbi:MAG: tRNA epoxyqueuosine(34) reductase QueG [Candidatus Hydrogenedentota bacterium]